MHVQCFPANTSAKCHFLHSIMCIYQVNYCTKMPVAIVVMPYAQTWYFNLLWIYHKICRATGPTAYFKTFYAYALFIGAQYHYHKWPQSYALCCHINHHSVCSVLFQVIKYSIIFCSSYRFNYWGLFLSAIT